MSRTMNLNWELNAKPRNSDISSLTTKPAVNLKVIFVLICVQKQRKQRPVNMEGRNAMIQKHYVILYHGTGHKNSISKL